MSGPTYQWDAEELQRLDLQAAYSWHLLAPHLEAAGLHATSRVLDAGCGTGRVTAQLAKAIGPSGHVTGVDIDPALLTMAAAAPQPEAAASIVWREADVCDPDALGSDYDIAVAHMVLQHLPDPLAAVRALATAVRPGGTVVLLDADDALLDVAPRPEGFDAFQARAASLQAAMGGDRRIGRRLGSLAHQAGLVDVTPSVQLFTAPPNPMAHFLGAALGFKHHLFPKEEQADAMAALGGFQQELSAPGAYGMIGMFAVRATRPA